MIRSSLVCEPLKWLLIQQKLISATDERYFIPKNKANSLLLVAAQGRTTQKIKKELSICQSLFCLDLVSFPVLSQIKPQAPIFSKQPKLLDGLTLKWKDDPLTYTRLISKPLGAVYN
jgi:hypothetical protein